MLCFSHLSKLVLVKVTSFLQQSLKFCQKSFRGLFFFLSDNVFFFFCPFFAVQAFEKTVIVNIVAE